jgi:putative membrane protein (TIGR04086 family)
MARLELDWGAIGIGAAVALALAVPAAVIGQAVVGDDEEVSNVVFLFTAVILAGCAAGGFVAASKRPDAPLSHGAIAALAAYVVVQGIGIAAIVVRDDEIRIARIVFNALLSASVGMIGGLVAERRRGSGAVS